MTQYPVRTCVGCRAKRPKRELLRVTSADGALVFDRKRKLPGRGFYLCPGRPCIDKGLTEKRLKKVTGAATKGLSTKGLSTKGLSTKGLSTKGLSTPGLSALREILEMEILEMEACT
jgi:hypothetical protein